MAQTLATACRLTPGGKPWLIGMLLLMQVGAAGAARPLLTDDARVVDRGSCQLEAWTVGRRPGHEAWAIPACTDSKGREWSLGGQFHEASAHDIRRQGLIQGKQVLREIRAADVGVAATIGYARTADEQGTAYLNVPLTWMHPNERTQVHLNGAIARAQATGRWARPWGVALEQQLSPSMALIAERYSASSGAHQTQLGIRWWWWPGTLQVDATAGRQQGSAATPPQNFWSLGIRWLFTRSS